MDHTLKPLAEERVLAFEARAQELAADRRPKTDRMASLACMVRAEAALRMFPDNAMAERWFIETRWSNPKFQSGTSV